jgi:hypothetical protein
MLTIFALFGSDVRVMSFGTEGDTGFDVITIICLIVFSFDIILNCLSRKDYFNSFFFWLDFISTISLILDIQLISQSLFYSSGTSGTSTAIAKAGKASKVGTRWLILLFYFSIFYFLVVFLWFSRFRYLQGGFCRN